jgi:anti-sigma B factor antagonist
MTVPFNAEITSFPKGVVLALSGEIDGSAADGLLGAYGRAVTEHDPATVVLDFSNVDYINSSGIALIVSVLARSRAEKRKVNASGLSDHYREIFEITRLSDFIDTCSDLATLERRLNDGID